MRLTILLSVLCLSSVASALPYDAAMATADACEADLSWVDNLGGDDWAPVCDPSVASLPSWVEDPADMCEALLDAEVGYLEGRAFVPYAGVPDATTHLELLSDRCEALVASVYRGAP